MEVVALQPAENAKVLHASIAVSMGHEFTLEVDIEVPPGITVLFGASGAGKSTLLDCLAGLRTPERGVISVSGRTLFGSERQINLAPQQRRSGYLFQTLALFPHLSVLRNVAYGLHALPAAQRRNLATAMLESFRVASMATRKPIEISGGERQRVALARALVTSPDFLLLDEPMSGLDASTKSKIIADLRDWNRLHPIPVLYVTHDQEEVFALGDRVIVLENGRNTRHGSPAEVLHEPSTETIAQLAGIENVFEATVLSTRPDDGAMTLKIAGSDLTLEVPLSSTTPGARVRLGIRAGDILVATERPGNISARNIFAGNIASLELGPRFVTVKVDSGATFETHVTRAAVKSLGLRVGQPVWLLIKTHSCHLLA